MVSINKFLLLAIMASVLIGAVCVKAEEASDKEPAKEEVSADKPETAAEEAKPAEGESPQKTVTDFSKKIFSGFKKAGKTIFSHIPFFSHGAAAANEKATEGSEASAEADAPAEAAKDAEPKEESKEKSA